MIVTYTGMERLDPDLARAISWAVRAEDGLTTLDRYAELVANRARTGM